MSTLLDCVATAKLLLNHPETDMDAIFELWANQALSKLTCPELRMYKYCEACPDYNGRIEKPKGFLRPLMIRIRHKHYQGLPPQNGTGEPVRHHHHHDHYMVYVDEPFFGNCGLGVGGYRHRDWYGKYQMNGNYIQLFGDFHEIDKVDLCYQSLNVDESGAFMVEELWEPAIQFYICYMYSMMPKSEIPANLRAEYRDNWILNANKANSDAQLRLFQQQRPQIMSLMLSMITDKNIIYPK